MQGFVSGESALPGTTWPDQQLLRKPRPWAADDAAARNI